MVFIVQTKYHLLSISLQSLSRLRNQNTMPIFSENSIIRTILHEMKTIETLITEVLSGCSQSIEKMQNLRRIGIQLPITQLLLNRL